MDYEICILRVEEFKKFIDKLDKDSKARLTRDIDFLKKVASALGTKLVVRLE